MAKKDASSRTSAETITPLSVPIRNKGNGKDTLQRQKHYGIIILLGALVVVIAAGAFFLHYLSKIPIQPKMPIVRQLPETKESKETKIQVPEEKPPDVDPDQIAADKAAAEQNLAEFLEIRGGLDRIGAAEWGGETYMNMAQIGREADTHFMNNEYRLAVDKYKQAAALAVELSESSAEVLRRLLQEGSEGLKNGDGELAQKKFAVALLIDPSNPSAQHGLRRAQTIETVKQLVASGKQHEETKDLIQARTDYQEALEIDPDFVEAQQALNRVTRQIKETQFQRLMSSGLTALNDKNYSRARDQLLKAKSIKPDSREVSDALIQVDQAIRLTRIDTLRKEAQSAEKTENWQAALRTYLAVLEIDKNLQFATRGKERSLEQIRIAKRLAFFIDKPSLLESDNQLKNAVLLLNEAKAIRPQGSKLTANIKALERLVAIAQTTVKVTIESDNLTQVAVYRVGKLGRFLFHELELRPGVYTVVGSRDGYQDVRQKIIIKPDQRETRVTIKCRIKI